MSWKPPNYWIFLIIFEDCAVPPMFLRFPELSSTHVGILLLPLDMVLSAILQELQMSGVQGTDLEGLVLPRGYGVRGSFG